MLVLALRESFGYYSLVSLHPSTGKRTRIPDNLISGDDDQTSDQCLQVLPGGLKEADGLLLWLVYHKVLIDGTAEMMRPAK